MLKKVLFVVLLIIALVVVWSVFRSFRSAPSGESSPGLSQTNFLTALSQQVTSGIPAPNTTSPAEVSLEELGEFSPVAGMVAIEKKDLDSIKSGERADEYIVLRARETNAEPINISNWSLQSMVSDVWIGLPQGVERYVAGEVNELQDISLRPGERAIVATTHSPVGVSFRTNRCSGFLESTQDFEPPLRTDCIDPRALMPPTVENLKTYGPECVQFAENFDRCTYVTPKTRGYAQLSPACREYLRPRLTYNYCVGLYENEPGFFSGEWRIFLNQDAPLWRENYEVIRLLDERNRTVDVLTY